jgi:hypothetical protein
MTTTSDLSAKLHLTTDASIWASEFCKLNPNMDEETMIGWFANEIEATKDITARKIKNESFNDCSLEEQSDKIVNLINEYKTILKNERQMEVTPERRTFYVNVDTSNKLNKNEVSPDFLVF